MTNKIFGAKIKAFSLIACFLALILLFTGCSAGGGNDAKVVLPGNNIGGNDADKNNGRSDESVDIDWMTDQTLGIYGKVLSTGGEHSLAIKSDGSLWAWGDNYYGQLGDGTKTTYKDKNVVDENRDSYIPIKIMEGVIMVSAGDAHSVAIDDNNDLYTWGDNAYGQLGDGTKTARLSPIKVMSDVVYADAGRSATIAIKSDGSLWAWGFNSTYGEETVSGPRCIMDNVKKAEIGNSHILVLGNNGDLYEGLLYIVLGYGDIYDLYYDPKSSPYGDGELTIKMSGVADIAVGMQQSFALMPNGDLYAWGANGRVDLGTGSTEFWPRYPELVANDVKKICDGGRMLIKKDNSLWIWGEATTSINHKSPDAEYSGGTMIEDLIVYGNRPVKILDDVVFAGGHHHYLAVDTAGKMYTWGNNTHGQLGNGTCTVLDWIIVADYSEYEEIEYFIVQDYQVLEPQLMG